MIGQSQIVVGAEVKQGTAVNRYVAIHRRFNGANPVKQARRLQGGQLIINPGNGFVSHKNSPWVSG
jgi:hypothetical protein